jgi:F0F1-type ATP synthase assembly protein I
MDEPDGATAKLPDPPKLLYQRPQPVTAPLRGPRGIRVDATEARSMGQGWTIASSLVSSLIAGILLGMAVDRWLLKAATPWGLIVGFLLGCVSGFANLLQQAARLERESSRDARR